ncbi:MAG: dephospho-CoA kinase, partial [Candidatus Omnitrophota bacterium]
NFGDGVFTKGRIDTAKLKVAAFASKRALEKLCRIVHPRVIEIMKKEAKKSDKAVTVLDAPLLIEAGLSKDVDYVVVVTATMEKRIEHAAAREYTKKDIYLRKARQMALGEKIKRADFVINNNRSKRYMKKQIRGIWQTLNGR